MISCSIFTCFFITIHPVDFPNEMTDALYKRGIIDNFAGVETGYYFSDGRVAWDKGKWRKDDWHDPTRVPGLKVYKEDLDSVYKMEGKKCGCIVNAKYDCIIDPNVYPDAWVIRYEKDGKETLLKEGDSLSFGCEKPNKP